MNNEFLLNRGEYFKYNVGINSEISFDDFKVNCVIDISVYERRCS